MSDLRSPRLADRKCGSRSERRQFLHFAWLTISSRNMRCRTSAPNMTQRGDVRCAERHVSAVVGLTDTSSAGGSERVRLAEMAFEVANALAKIREGDMPLEAATVAGWN